MLDSSVISLYQHIHARCFFKLRDFVDRNNEAVLSLLYMVCWRRFLCGFLMVLYFLSVYPKSSNIRVVCLCVLFYFNI